MCGIAGIWNLNGRDIDPEILKVFTDSMFHRGPDGAGYSTPEKNLGLGHRRLSILDLTDNAKQPMVYADENFHITYNGEVFNFIEIRKDLQLLGHSFRTESDTEVILAAYAQWGEDCLLRFNGMWAFALYNKKERSLFLARDRFGIKPLHYLHVPGELFAFASETIAFKHLKGHSRRMDDRQFRFALHSPSLLEPTGKTIFENIEQVKAGHTLRIYADGKKISKRWWRTSDHLVSVPEKYEDQVAQFRELFFDACKLRLRSDVSVASALSGGIDSSSVFCSINHLAAGHLSQERLPADWQKAFSISFPGTPVDEAFLVELIRKRTGGNIKILTPDYSRLQEDILSSTRLFDSITGTPIISLTDVYKGMRQNGITVSLDGHGGDEELFGYSSGVYSVLTTQIGQNDPAASATAEAYLALTRETVSKEEVYELIEKIKKQLPRNTSGLLSRIKKLVGKKEEKDLLPEHGKDSWNYGQQFLYNEFHWSELPYNLRDFDRASMQNSIEIRMPLMDYRLVTYCFSLPVESRIGKGFSKRILRDAMKGIVPDEILNRRIKIGLGAPTANWFNKELNNFVSDIASSQSFRESPYWNGEEVSAFMLQKCAQKNWTPGEARKYWNIINGHLLIHQE